MYHFERMKEKDALQLLKWHYSQPYHFYNWEEGPEALHELLHQNYYSVFDETGQLAGFTSYGQAAQVPGGFQIQLYNEQSIDLGLGMHPSRTGSGQGLAFVQAAVVHCASLYPDKQIQLAVAAFNERAIKVYERAGFQQKLSFRSRVKGEDILFIAMTKK